MEHNTTLHRRLSKTKIRYANCWEDASLLIKALKINKDSVCLSIASSGDNSLALLTQNPRLVVAVDLNPAQLACLELRIAAFAQLDYEQVIKFLGIKDEPNRISTYRSLRPDLSTYARCFWDDRLSYIKDGIIYHGKFEEYFHLFRKSILPLVHSRRTVQQLLGEQTEQERAEFYLNKWDNRRWRLLFQLFFSRFVMGRLGRDPEFFRYVKGPVGEQILSRVKQALITLPANENPYLYFILTGRFEGALPYYLQAENFPLIKANLDKLKIFCGSIEDALINHDDSFDAFNLSDIFEYMNEVVFKTIAENLVERAENGARFAYWNMLAPRRMSSLYPDRIKYLDSLSSQLFQEDRAFFYQSFFVEERI